MSVRLRLVALTREARHALGDRSDIVIDRFPFRFGRESRSAGQKAWQAVERRFGVASPNNDVYLIEERTGAGFQISREHFLIDVRDGAFVVVDRASMCGTIAAGVAVGGRRMGGETELQDEDEIIVGRPESPFVFQVLIE